MAEKNHGLDLNSIDAAINGHYNDKDNGVDASYQGTAPAPAPTPEPEVHEHQEPRPLQSPYMAIEFTYNDEKTSIDTFKIHADGVPATPEALLAHLETVVNTIREQNPTVSNG